MSASDILRHNTFDSRATHWVVQGHRYADGKLSRLVESSIDRNEYTPSAELQLLDANITIRFVEVLVNATGSIVHMSHSQISGRFTAVEPDWNRIIPGDARPGVVLQRSRFIADNCRFVRNIAYDGAAIFAEDSSIIMSRCAFEENSVTSGPSMGDAETSGRGAGIYALRSDLNLQECSFQNNYCKNARQEGGGMYLRGCNLSMSSTTFSGNKATQNGGAIFAKQSSIYMHDSNFSDNYGNILSSNRQDVKGGAIYVDNTPIRALDCHFKGNKANKDPTAGSAQGGSIYGRKSRFYVDHCSFTDDLAEDGGSAIYVSSPPSIRIFETTFAPYDPQQSVYIGGALGGCEEVRPCEPGFTCLYQNYSLSCSRCPANTYSSDGISCTSCPPGSGPNNLQSKCYACSANQYSTFGVCQDCLGHQVADTNHITCVDCPVHQVGFAGFCLCADNYYNVTSIVVPSCYEKEFDGDRTVQHLQGPCQPCPNCLSCPATDEPSLTPGYTIPDRRYAFRCGADVEQSEIRCPNILLAHQCAPEYDGALCQSCAEGYSRSSQRCISCTDRTYQASWPLVAILLVAATYGFKKCCRCRRRKRTTDIAMTSMDENLMYGATDPPAELWEDVLDDTPKVSTSSRRCFHTGFNALYVRLAMRATFQPVRMVRHHC
jgi:predicted outer membrane repeat protein